MELGGHAPVIVCDDVDPVAAARISAAAKFRNAGQICVAPTRFLVQERIHDAFVDALVSSARAIRLGDGLQDGVQMGPLANRRRIVAMERLVEDAVARGARLATGGKRHGNRGNFFEPTVLTDVPLEAAVMNEEPFGPLAPVIPFRDLDEALEIASSLPFGLASYAFTHAAETIAELAERVESGMISINHLGGSLPETPFGGIKESGYGREGGSESLDSFMITKFVSHRMRLQ